MATLEEIAKRLGVTKGTVSKALNGAGDVSESMRQMILATAVEMGYTRISRRGNPRCVCIFVENMAYEKPGDFGLDLILGFRQIAEPNGFKVNIVPLTKDLQSRYTYDEYMLLNNYEGAFFMGMSFQEPWMDNFETVRTPAVLYDSPVIRNPIVTTVGIDNLEGMQLAVSWLKELGHVRIGYLGGAPGSFVYRVRYDAFFQAMKENDLEVSGEYAGVAFLSSDCLKLHFQRLIDLGCTALICSHDLLAHAALIHCRESGLRVPEDISIIGVDDLPLCSHTVPPLASIRQDRLSLGKTAFYALHSHFDHIPLSSFTLHAELIRRGSVGPARQGGLRP